MHSSNTIGIYNPAYTDSTTDLNVKTDHTEPSSTAVKPRIFPNDPDNILTDENNDCNADDKSNSRTGCAAAYRRFLSDWRGFSLLTFLYILQGLPLGFVASVPLIIIEKTNSYGIQAKFNNTIWSHTLKLLWAPLVDVFYFKRIGRRKSWLIPLQLLIGSTLLLLYFQVDNLIDNLQIGWLTAIFFFFNVLSATHDIAVDGWALTMLKRENVALASTCNLVGQEFGKFIAHTVFLNLASADFANYFRSEPGTEGLLSISGFMLVWACIVFITSTLIFLFKHEDEENLPNDKNIIIKSYVRLYEIIKLPAVRWVALIYLTRNIGFAAVNHVSTLKLVEYGLPKESQALLSGSLIPFTLLLPLLIARWTAGRKPMGLFFISYAVGLVVSGAVAVMVWTTGEVKDRSTGTGFPAWYFPALLLVEAALKICVITQSATTGGFNCKISDPEYGGTFMTLYNTLWNIGLLWSSQLVLWLVDPITITTQCVQDAVTVCDKPTTRIFDGYYIETIACIVLGFCWLHSVRKLINKLQKKPESEWKLIKSSM